VRQPKYSVEVDSEGRTNFIADLRGVNDPGPRPLAVRCDFCGQPSTRLNGRVLRAVSVEPLGDSRRRVTLPDPCHWWACVICDGLVRIGDIETLVARVTVLLDLPCADHRHWYALYQGLLAAATGRMDRWETGQPWPVAVGG
jgi:hypothetical protein